MANRLNASLKEEVRLAYLAGAGIRKLTRDFRVSQNTVRKMIRGEGLMPMQNTSASLSPAVQQSPGHGTRCDYSHEYSVLKTVLGFYATRFDRKYHLPFLPDHPKNLKVREKSPQTKDLTIEEFTRFKAVLKAICTEAGCEAIYFIAMMQYATYSRVQEAAALHAEDFDFNRRKLRVVHKVQWMRAKGKSSKIVDGSKTNGGKEIEMPEMAACLFREWALKSGVRSGPLFLNGGVPYEYRQIEYRYTQALKRADPFSATHILRHAALTEHYATCGDLKITAKVAGHDDIKSTDKYAKVRDERVAHVQREMDRKLSSIL